MKVKNKKIYYYVIFFDEKCILCQKIISFILKFEKKDKLKFAPLNGNKASLFLKEQDIMRTDDLIFFDGENTFYKGKAVLKILRLLIVWFYPLYLLASLLPLSVLDRIYDLLFKNRTKLFGRTQMAYTPHSAELHRFLD